MLSKITSESAIAAGIRRIEALTLDGVEDFYLNQEKEEQNQLGIKFIKWEPMWPNPPVINIFI